ncbi:MULTISPECIES: DUF4331 family protein [Streptacidiphilus]|uniref:DUF4331 family protein n=1 Tax=Streptacidiphilus cavernicola TaxID=3342716 RepID=A0ABV6V131_9ACTN|nr:DUF4331 family protein [Streptacidiphilus jeojiense]
MSHHLDTPLAARSGQLLIDDLYVFPGQDSTVFVVNVNSDITGTCAKPGFHSEARYEFKVHLDGADFEALTYRFAFDEPDEDGQQAYTMGELTGQDAQGDLADSPVLAQGRTGESVRSGGVRIYAGRIADCFYIDLSLLARINAAVADGSAPQLADWQPQAASNSFAGTTVQTIVLEVPHSHPVLRPGTRIGLWAATKLATDAGGWRQVNRAGHPMMWPIFWPTDVEFTNPANTRHPSQDAAAAGKQIADQVAAVVRAAGTSADPDGYGNTVACELFPDVLPYVLGTPAGYGFAARNGRTLADNAPEAMLSLVLNTAVPSGLTPATAQALRLPDFPYVRPA